MRSVRSLVGKRVRSPPVRTFGHTVHQFRFLPESYLAAVGAQWDPGLDLLVYLRMFIEEETEDAMQ